VSLLLYLYLVYYEEKEWETGVIMWKERKIPNKIVLETYKNICQLQLYFKKGSHK